MWVYTVQKHFLYFFWIYFGRFSINHCPTQSLLACVGGILASGAKMAGFMCFLVAILTLVGDSYKSIHCAVISKQLYAICPKEHILLPRFPNHIYPKPMDNWAYHFTLCFTRSPNTCTYTTCLVHSPLLLQNVSLPSKQNHRDRLVQNGTDGR